MKNQGSMLSSKDINNSPTTELKGVKQHDLADKEFKIAILKKLSELKENSVRQFNEILKKKYDQTEVFFKEIETHKKETNGNSRAE